MISQSTPLYFFSGVFEDFNQGEVILWIANWGYILHEILSLALNGFHDYISDKQNRFDVVICSLFIAMMGIRWYSIASKL